MRPHHIVLDTNVLVSAILFGGKPRSILEKIRKGDMHCFLSPPIIDEFRDVLQRPKFGLSRDAALQIAEELQSICRIAFPATTHSVIKADPDDNRILECAQEADVDVIVSGNPHLLRLKTFGSIRILSPAEFVAGYPKEAK